MLTFLNVNGMFVGISKIILIVNFRVGSFGGQEIYRSHSARRRVFFALVTLIFLTCLILSLHVLRAISHTLIYQYTACIYEYLYQIILIQIGYWLFIIVRQILSQHANPNSALPKSTSTIYRNSYLMLSVEVISGIKIVFFAIKQISFHHMCDVALPQNKIYNFIFYSDTIKYFCRFFCLHKIIMKIPKFPSIEHLSTRKL